MALYNTAEAPQVQGGGAPQTPSGPRNYMQWQYDRKQRQQRQNQMSGTASQNPMESEQAKLAQSTPSPAGSPVGSNGRISASPPPAPLAPPQAPPQAPLGLWNGAAPAGPPPPGTTAAPPPPPPVNAPQTQNAGNVPPPPPGAPATAEAQPYWNAQNPFNQNQWQRGPTSEQDKNYWQWAVQQQTGNPDFWGTLQEGTSQSGSPQNVWVKAPGGEWGTMAKTDYEAGRKNNPSAAPAIPDAAQFNAGNLGNDPFATYTPGQVTQFQEPNMGNVSQLGLTRVEQMLQNPGTMSDFNVQQMRAQQNEQVQQSLRDRSAQLAQQQAFSGRLGSGYQNAVNARAADEGQRQLLAGSRDLSLLQGQTNRNDTLQALAASSAWQNGQMGLATQGFDARLAGENAQNLQNYQGYGSQLTAQDAALQRAMQQQGLNLQQAQQYAGNWATQQGLQNQNLSRGLTETLGNQDAQLRRDALGNEMTRFGKTIDQEEADRAERRRQFNLGEERNWSQLGINRQTGLFGQLNGGQ